MQCDIKDFILSDLSVASLKHDSENEFCMYFGTAIVT
jgi:hypothetical protein